MRNIWIMGLLFLSTSVLANSQCEDRDFPEICYKMDHLRSHVMLLDAQRELMQVNFPYIAEIGKGMNDVAAHLMASSFYETHLTAIDSVKALSQQIIDEAQARNVEVLRTANQVKEACQNCHLGTDNPDISEIFARDWGVISDNCNAPGRIPFVCKNMHSFSQSLTFFETAFDGMEVNYGLAGMVAGEMNRVAFDLIDLGNFHQNSRDIIPQVLRESAQIRALAAEEDIELYSRASELRQNCMRCHQ